MAAMGPICEMYGINCLYLNGPRTSNVWLPNMPRLPTVRTCFSVTCLCLNENNGNWESHNLELEISGGFFHWNLKTYHFLDELYF